MKRSGGIAMLAVLLAASCGAPKEPVGPAAASDPASVESAAAPDKPDTGVPAPAPAPRSEVEFGTPTGRTGVYGAIGVVADGNFLVGYGAYDFPDRRTAERGAIEGCEASSAKAGRGDLGEGCKAALYFYNACGALAQSAEGAWGTGWADNGWRNACSYAVASCKDAGGADCEGFIYICSPGGLRGTCDGAMQLDGGTTRLGEGG